MIKSTIAAAALSALLLPLTAQAVTTVYNVSLSGAQEVPSVATLASGTFQLTVDDVLDTVSFGLAALNLSGAVSGTHIHMAPMGANGGVVFNMLTAGNFDSLGPIMAGPFALPNSFTVSGSNKSVGSLADMINAAPWNFYVNLHTLPSFGGGEIRGQLAPVPEVGTYAMMALGLGLLGFVARRRRAS